MRRNSAKKRRHSRESGNLFGEINFRISANFTRKLSLESPRIFCKKRGECGILSVKMDSRFRGNDGGNPHILREKLILEFPQNDREIKFFIPAKFRENKITTRPRHLSGAKQVRRSLLRPRNFRLPAAIYRSRKMPGFAAVNCCG